MSDQSQKFSFKNKYFLISIAIFVVYIFSFNYKFLDPFVVGTWHEKIGFDYFSIPRSFINLQWGKSIFNTTFFPFGPYASNYYYHPVLSILLGSWLSLFSPWVSYFIFVTICFGVLTLSAKILNDVLQKDGKEYLIIVFSLATYLLLWNAQVHVFMILSMVFILRAYSAELNRETKNAGIFLCWGLLLSLFTKPIIILGIPYLLMVKTFRRPIYIATIVYTVVSLMFIFVPFLNPANDNTIHWTNLMSQANYFDQNDEIFSTAWIFDYLNMFSINLLYMFKLPLLVSLLPLSKWPDLQEHEIREFSIIGFVLTMTSYFLSYQVVWEYHYSHLLPFIGFMIWSGRFKIKWLIVAYILISIPGIFGLYKGSGMIELLRNLLSVQKIFKLTGVLIIYLTLLKRIYQLCHVGEEEVQMKVL